MTEPPRLSKHPPTQVCLSLSIYSAAQVSKGHGGPGAATSPPPIVCDVWGPALPLGEWPARAALGLE